MRVMVFGSFDPLHEGHRSLFRQARRYGNDLFVVVAKDSSIRSLKRREPRRHEEERLAAVQKEPLVDHAVLGYERDFLAVIKRNLPDVIVLGYDQKTFTDEELRERLTKEGFCPEIKRAIAFKPETYKSSLISRE